MTSVFTMSQATCQQRPLTSKWNPFGGGYGNCEQLAFSLIDTLALMSACLLAVEPFSAMSRHTCSYFWPTATITSCELVVKCLCQDENDQHRQEQEQEQESERRRRGRRVVATRL